MESTRAKNDSLTPSQRQAVEARGNVLVMAGAGTGKTHTLVERCLDCLCRERVSIDEILVVTFTEAAATEMKQRLRTVLEAALNTRSLGSRKHPLAPTEEEGGPRKAGPDEGEPGALQEHLAEQLALFDTAPIGTLHSFCLRLVREHFYELGLDPQLAVLDPGEARLLAEETLDEQFKSHYAGQTDFSVAVQNLIQIYGNGDDRPIRALLLRLHHYIQTRPDADRWLTRQLTRFASPEPLEWREWLKQAVDDWREEWLPILKNLGAPASDPARHSEHARSETGVPAANKKATELLKVLGQTDNKTTFEVLEKILAADENYPAGKKIELRKPLKDLFSEATFLQSLVPVAGQREPLAEDWDWVRGYMTALLQLAQEFGQRFADRKRFDGLLDFHDLEQYTLKLLWDSVADKPTVIAQRWRQKIRFVFVDEYQDINAAQDKIIGALSREGKDANRFLVGDVKQSIYRFRLADPKIFRDYSDTWRGVTGRVIPLSENFRSREGLLGFINSFFESLMSRKVSGVEYNEEARLQFGAPEQRAVLSSARDTAPRAELLICFKGTENSKPEDGDSGNSDLVELEAAEKEARLAAHRLRALVAAGHKIWDEENRAERAVEWRDLAVLLRAPANKAEAYAKEFERAGVPLIVERGGFYDSKEIADLLSLLRLLDNPLQDIPVIAMLRSPLVGLSLDELARIRLAAKGEHIWTALNRMQNAECGTQSELHQKIERFLDRFSRWRQLARRASLSQCLESVLAETHYTEWLRSCPRGTQRQANIERFLNLAQQFDQFQRQGLFRFLQFIEAQQAVDAEPEVAATAEENAVRLMSIHQSKGLEFPVVVVADLAKAFNEQDLRGEILFDEEFGICARVQPPHTGRRYPSLPHWLAQRRQRREQRGEELRLLYVAMTRARDTLILTATLSESKWDSFWQKPESATDRTVVNAKSCADWLGIWFGIRCPAFGVRNSTRGEWPHLRWEIVPDAELSGPSVIVNQHSAMEWPALDRKTQKRLHGVLSWEYAFDAATQRAAKSSVTALRRRAEQLDDEAAPLFQDPSPSTIPHFRERSGRAPSKPQTTNRKTPLSAAAVGTAHHKFLQHFSMEKANDLKWLETEAKRLEVEKILSVDESSVLDLANIAAFWASPVGKKILSQRKWVQRELPFTAKFSPAEVDAITGARTPAGLKDEFIVVQGVADLVVRLPEAIWLVDFKTDEIKPRELAGRKQVYEPQLELYAKALARIYSQPVTNCWLHFLAVRHTVKLRI